MNVTKQLISCLHIAHPLTCIQEGKIIYSFSTPATLASEVESIITSWVAILRCATQKYAIQLNVCTDTVCLPHIVL